MEYTFLLIIFIIAIVLEKILDNWLLVAIIGSILILISLIREFVYIKKVGFDVQEFFIIFFKILGIAALFGFNYLL